MKDGNLTKANHLLTLFQRTWLMKLEENELYLLFRLLSFICCLKWCCLFFFFTAVVAKKLALYIYFNA